MEEKKENNNGMKRLEEALHNKSPLPSLRTYQGDMAEFIKEKNESVLSVAVKEKMKKEKEEEKEKKVNPEKKTGNKQPFHINLTILALSLLLIGGGAFAFMYILQFTKKEPVNQTTSGMTIIPYNNSISIQNVTGETLIPELKKLSAGNGITNLKVVDTKGVEISNAQNFFYFLAAKPPADLVRTLEGEFFFGFMNQKEKLTPFVIIKVKDFGIAFSAMLEWEDYLADDFDFVDTKNLETSTSTTTPATDNSFVWKDVIAKNKDARTFVNNKGVSKVTYTFLDKNTILITNNMDMVGEVTAIYASRSFTR